MKQKKFTIIELLVVVAIIAILAALLLPALQKARKTSYIASCQSNLKQVVTGLTSYSSDFGGWGPMTTSMTGAWNYPYIWNHPYIKGYLIPINAAHNGIFKSVVCPGWTTLTTGSTYRPGRVDVSNKRVYSNYNVVYGTSIRTGTDEWFGWLGSSVSSMNSGTCLPCPNIKMLGRKISYGSYAFRFGTPATQPIAGDMTGRVGDDTVNYYASGNFPWSHAGSNNAFFDGHVSWTSRLKFDRSFSTIFSSSTIRWGQ